MQTKIPTLETKKAKQSVSTTVSITVSRDMDEAIKKLKDKHGCRPVNSWLRDLWQMGLDSFEPTGL